MTSRLEKGGGTFEGIKLLLCENPLPPINDPVLGPGFMRVTKAPPEDNERVVAALRDLL